MRREAVSPAPRPLFSKRDVDLVFLHSSLTLQRDRRVETESVCNCFFFFPLSNLF